MNVYLTFLWSSKVSEIPNTLSFSIIFLQYWSELSDWISLALPFNTTASLNHTPCCQGGLKSEIELIDNGGSLIDNIVRVTLK